MRDRHHTPSVMVESYHTEHTERSHLRTKSHISHDQETRKLQLEIDHLHNKLRRKEHDRSSSPSLSDGSREVGIAHIAIGQELHPMSPSQHCHTRIN